MNLNPSRWFSRILLSGAMLLATMASPAAAQSLSIPIPIPGIGNLPVNIPIPIPGLNNGYNGGYYNGGGGGYYGPGGGGGYYPGGGYSQPGITIPIPGLSYPGGGGYRNPGYSQGGGYYEPGYQDEGYYQPGYSDGGGYRRQRGGRGGNWRQRGPGMANRGNTRYPGSGHDDHEDHQSGPVGPGAPADYGLIREHGQFIRVADEHLPVRVYSNDPKFDDVLSQAIAEWNSAGAGQLFGQVSSADEADYTIDWSGRGLPREAAGVCVMEPGRDGVRVSGLTIDTRRRQTPRGNLTEIVMQEMGHSLGLNHSENPADIMYDTVHEEIKRDVSDAHITERDAQMVTWLYKQTAFVPIMSQGTERAAMRR